jgi:hypothetical protein
MVVATKRKGPFLAKVVWRDNPGQHQTVVAINEKET